MVALVLMDHYLRNRRHYFSVEPAVGGPADSLEDSTEVGMPDFVASLNELSSQLENRAQQLGHPENA